MTNQSPCESLPEANKVVIDGLNQQITQAKEASLAMSLLSESEKNLALELIERELRESVSEIIAANEKDLTNPDNADLTTALKDRLKLDSQRIMGMATGIRKIMAIPDPIGQVLEGWQHPNGMKITKYRVPLGVIGIIYEARPNVTTDAIALAIKSGNSVVLRGSRQAWNTNLAIMNVVNRALKQTKVPVAAIQYLADKSREGCKVLLRAEGLIDLVIPRGGEDLNKFVTDNSLIPVLGAGGGTCHTYIDEFADPDKAIAITVNVKVSRPSVCNSCETLLVHKARVDDLLRPLVEALQDKGVEVFGDQAVQAKCSGVEAATEEDWGREYLDLKIAVKVVDELAEAIQHINFYSTGHSEAIVTEDINNAELFKRMINSACVYVNASTRFTDGEEFGFGAEMGISTQKMHARGPIGARELCSYKYVIEGNGQIR